MKKSIKWIIIALVTVAFFVGAYLLYNSLSEDYGNSSLIIDLPAAGDTGASTDAMTGTPDASSDTDLPTDTEDPSKVTDTETKGEDLLTNPAADFTVYDKNGNAVKLSDMRGKPVVINFWASWCPPCKAELPDFEEVYKKYDGEIVFMMVNMTDGYQETKATATAHVNQNGYTFPVYFDTDSSAAIAYSVSSLPATYLIDKHGNLVAHAIGMIDADILEEGIDLIK